MLRKLYTHKKRYIMVKQKKNKTIYEGCFMASEKYTHKQTKKIRRYMCNVVKTNHIYI